MDENDILNEKLQEFIDSVISAACKVFEKFCKLIKEFLKYLSETLYSSEWWIYMQTWFEVCAKNPKSLHYMRYCKKYRIRKKHVAQLIKITNRIYARRRKNHDS